MVRFMVGSAPMNEALEAAIRKKLSMFAADLVELCRAAIEERFASLTGDGLGAEVRAERGGREAPGGRSRRQQRLIVGPSSVRSVDVAATSSRGGSGAGEGGRQRRSHAQLDAVAARIERFVRSHPGARSEETKRALSIARKEWARPIGRLIDAGRIRTTGVRRATRYFPAT